MDKALLINVLSTLALDKKETLGSAAVLQERVRQLDVAIGAISWLLKAENTEITAKVKNMVPIKRAVKDSRPSGDITLVKESFVKECGHCHKVKFIEEFGIRSLSKTGRAGACFTCMEEYYRDWQQRHRERQHKIAQVTSDSLVTAI